MKPLIKFPYESFPSDKLVLELVPGVYWVRLNLSAVVSHVNAYIIRDGDDITIVDTGIANNYCKKIWEKILLNEFKDVRVKRLIITHHHPDHLGLLGWFHENFQAEIWSSRVTWLTARMLTLDFQKTVSKETLSFWHASGMPDDLLSRRRNDTPFNFSDYVDPIPLGYRRIVDKETISIGDNSWDVNFGYGHAPEHITMHCPDLNVFIVGDQILPGISPNLSVYPTEPEANPVGEFIQTCERLLSVEDRDCLVLPGHNLPFRGLRLRTKQLLNHHLEALSRVKKFLLQGPRLAVEIFIPLYKREIKDSEFSLALGEAIGHLNYLWYQNIISREIAKDGKIYYKINKN